MKILFDGSAPPRFCKVGFEFDLFLGPSSSFDTPVVGPSSLIRLGSEMTVFTGSASAK